MMLCNCCSCNNAPMAIHEGYWICDDCVERYGSYDNAVYIINARKAVGLDKVPKEIQAETEELYKYYKKRNFPEHKEDKQ